MLRPAILSAGTLIGAVTAANAQTPMMATHNGSLMEMLPAPGGGLVVQYARPRSGFGSKREDGATISVEFNIVPLQNNGQQIGMAAIMRDVTRRFDEMRALR